MHRSVRFTLNLAIGWEYPGDEPTGARMRGSIDDCEALTLADETVWIYSYSDYPVVKVAGERPRAWWPAKGPGTAPGGIQAIAVADDLVGIVGGYKDRDATRVQIVDLAADNGADGKQFISCFPMPADPQDRSRSAG